MNSPKPRIKPKAEPYHRGSETPLRDPPSHPERDPPVFTEQDPGVEHDEAAERVIFQEDDCLR